MVTPKLKQAACVLIPIGHRGDWGIVRAGVTAPFQATCEVLYSGYERLEKTTVPFCPNGMAATYNQQTTSAKQYFVRVATGATAGFVDSIYVA